MTLPAAHALPTCPAEGHTSTQPRSIAQPWAPAWGYPSHREALPGVDLKEGQSGRSPACRLSCIQAESEGGSWELDAEGPIPPRESPMPPREASPFPGSPAAIEQWTQAPFQLQGRTWPRSAGMGAPLGGRWVRPQRPERSLGAPWGPAQGPVSQGSQFREASGLSGEGLGLA